MEILLILLLLAGPAQEGTAGQADSRTFRLRPLLQQAQQALDAGRLEEAVSLLEQILQEDERNRLARQALVDTLMRLARWEDVRGHLHILELQHPGDPAVLTLAAQVAFRTGNFERASQLARQSLDLAPRQWPLYRLLALSRYMLKDREGFLESLHRLLELNPEDAEGYYHLGRFHYEEQSYEEASKALERVVELDPEHYRAHYYLAWCHQIRGNHEASRKSYQRSVQLIEKQGVRFGWPFTDLGDLLVSRGEYQEGLGWLYRGIRNDPQLPYTYFKYAAALLREEASPEIEWYLQEALRLDPEYAEAYYVLGRYYTKVGEKEKARQAFEKFQELQKDPKPSRFGLRP